MPNVVALRYRRMVANAYGYWMGTIRAPDWWIVASAEILGTCRGCLDSNGRHDKQQGESYF